MQRKSGIHHNHVRLQSETDRVRLLQLQGGSLLSSMMVAQYQPETAQTIERFGNLTVSSVRICRTPLNSLLTGAINTLSGGRYERMRKAGGYSAFFHLFMVFQTSQGPLTIEKNETVHVAAGNPAVRTTEVLPVPSFPAITVKQIMDAVRERQGDHFFRYNASSNNCQQFISDLLQSVGITDPSIINWVRQDTESIFRGQPALRQIANTVTDLAALGQTARQAPLMARRKAIQLAPRPVGNFVRDNDRRVDNFKRDVGRKVKRFFGGDVAPKMLVKDMKSYIKQNKRGYPRPIRITGMKKAELAEIVAEIQAWNMINAA